MSHKRGVQFWITFLVGGGLGVLLLSFLLFLPRESVGLAPEEKQPPSSQTRTLKFFIFQEPRIFTATPTVTNATTTQFSIFIGDKDPVIKNAYIEIRGVVDTTAIGGNISVDINQTNSFPTARYQTFDVDNATQGTHLRLLYNGSSVQSLTSYLAGIITVAGSYSFYIDVDLIETTMSLLQARLVITYSFTPPTEAGGFPATGTLISPIFDTGAVNGATFNWIKAVGSTPAGTKVRVQIATSNSSSGPFTYLGPDCTANTYYYDGALPSPNESKEIGCQANHHNKRYFRYKVILCSNSTCSGAGGSVTPQVDDVIVNWSP